MADEFPTVAETNVNSPETIKNRNTKATMAVTISLITEIIKATTGKSMPNSLDVTAVPDIAASTLSANLSI